MIKVIVEDGTGRGYKAVVTEHLALSVAQEIPDVPEIGTRNRYRYWSGLLGTEGLDEGTTSANVDGSATAQTFYARSVPEYDIQIMSVNLVISDTTILLRNFGAIAGGLTNGIDIYVKESGVETFLVREAKTNGQVILQAGDPNGWVALSAYQLNIDALMIQIPLSNAMCGGLRLGRGTLEQMALVVNDDLTGLSDLTCRVFGRRHYP